MSKRFKPNTRPVFIRVIKGGNQGTPLARSKEQLLVQYDMLYARILELLNSEDQTMQDWGKQLHSVMCEFQDLLNALRTFIEKDNGLARRIAMQLLVLDENVERVRSKHQN